MADAEFNHRTLTTYKLAERLPLRTSTSIHVHSASEEPIFLPSHHVGRAGRATHFGTSVSPPTTSGGKPESGVGGGEEILVSPAMKLISRASVAVFVSFKNSCASDRDYFFISL